VAFEGRNQADVREAEVGFVAFLGDLKDNVGAIPLSLVFDKVESGVRYMSYNFLAWYQFSDLLGAAVKVFVVELKLSTEFVGSSFDFF
jgi:hypothetical protein